MTTLHSRYEVAIVARSDQKNHALLTLLLLHCVWFTGSNQLSQHNVKMLIVATTVIWQSDLSFSNPNRRSYLSLDSRTERPRSLANSSAVSEPLSDTWETASRETDKRDSERKAPCPHSDMNAVGRAVVAG